MAKLKRSDLVKAGRELQKEIGCDPEINTGKDATNEYLQEMILTAVGLIDPKVDQISDETMVTVEALQQEVLAKEKGGEKIKDGNDHYSDMSFLEYTSTRPETHKTKGEKTRVPGSLDLSELLAATKKLVDLKALVEEHAEFKKLRKDLDQYKGMQGPRELRIVMEKCLGTKLAEKKTPAAKKDKRPGVIATIAKSIEDSGKKGITKEEILIVLEKAFPDRDATAMSKTINVQVPNRITKEKFEVEKTKVGSYRKA